MDDEQRILLAMLAEERHAAYLVADLVSQGFSRDEALGLVKFPHDD